LSFQISVTSRTTPGMALMDGWVEVEVRMVVAAGADTALIIWRSGVVG
jgi:hypothetical protein